MHRIYNCFQSRRILIIQLLTRTRRFLYARVLVTQSESFERFWNYTLCNKKNYLYEKIGYCNTDNVIQRLRTITLINLDIIKNCEIISTLS